MEKQQIVLGSHTLAERQEFVERHAGICSRSSRRKRYNNKSSGPAPKGSMSIHRAKMQCATKQWKKKIKRELSRQVI